MQHVIQIDLGGVNCYLLEKDKKFLLVDTGGHLFMDKAFDNRRERLEKELKKHGVNRSNLEWILLTHGDNDHTCNAAYIKEKYAAKTAIHKDDAYRVETPLEDSYLINCHYQSFLLNGAMKLLHKKIAGLMKKVNQEFQSFTPDEYLGDGETLTRFGFEGQILHVPGHTPGSICILTPNGSLLCGDLFGNNKKPAIAINAEDFDLLKKSVSRLRNKNISTVYPGHGMPFAWNEKKIVA